MLIMLMIGSFGVCSHQEDTQVLTSKVRPLFIGHIEVYFTSCAKDLIW
jgi:hypothetical protein